MSKDYYIYKALERHNRFATVIVNNPHNIIGCFLIGSQNYHLSDKQSDIDTVVLVAPTLKEIATNKKPISKTYIQANGEHTTIKDIRLFVDGVKKGRLECLEILHTVYSITNDNWLEHFVFYFTKQNKEKIARLNERAVIQSATGMIKSCNRKNAKPKDLYHSLRVKSFLQKYMNKEPYEMCLIGKPDMIACKRKSTLTNDDLAVLENNAKMAREILNNLDDYKYSLTDDEKNEIKKELDAFVMKFVKYGLQIEENKDPLHVPKKPYKIKEHKQNDYYCSICRYYLGDEMELKHACLQPKFCPNCGQKLDWNGER